jgi:hypothetical protein
MSRQLIEKAVWLESLERVRNVVVVLGQLYDDGMWLGALLFADVQGGFLLVVTFNPVHYPARGTPWESLFPPSHLRPISLVDACTNWRRYHLWLGGEICTPLRRLKLLPTDEAPLSEGHPSLAEVRAERDPPEGLP